MPLVLNIGGSPVQVDNINVVMNGVTDACQSVKVGNDEVWSAATGATEFDVTMTAGNLTQGLEFSQSAAGAVTVDWGDGTTADNPASLSVVLSHNYAAAGNYTIKMTVQDGQTFFLTNENGNDYFASTLTAVRFGPGVVKTGYSVFEYCTALTTVTLSDSITEVSYYSFMYASNLNTVLFERNVTTIGLAAFRDANLSQIVFPDSLITVENNAFRGNVALASVVVGPNATVLGTGAFYGCTNLTSFTCKAATPPTIAINGSTFKNVPADCAIYVPAASVATYQSTSGWSDRAAYIQAIPA